MREDDDDANLHAPRRDTLASTGRPPPTEALGVETAQQKAELEAALFGEPESLVEIGHYTIIGTLGSGGMGVVYVAHDRRLDRRVALKLLRHGNASEVARVRLQREAQAMARLSHPNVVTVHEVGTFRGQVFLAMEFVGGSHLRAWQAVNQPDWRTIVAAFIQAGEGLAAAHDAGIIHRDFKPDNVLVGDDGRIRVADFGLAHNLERGAESSDVRSPTSDPELTSLTPAPVDPEDAPPPSAMQLDTPLTETGAVVGTPAYMAPEQHKGLKIDARTDQFSFCVALWEALFGRRPFPGKNLQDLVTAVTAGKIEEPTDPGEIPTWLRAVVERGLSTDPNHRWPSMSALLKALARDPERARRRRLQIASLTTLVLASLSFLGFRAAAESRRNARQRYWNVLTEQLLEIERERGLRQATDDARRARNATRMSSYQRYRPHEGKVDHEDPTVAAVLLRDVEGDGRATEAWISGANQILGQPLSYAVLEGHRDLITGIGFSPDAAFVYTASLDGDVRRWNVASGASEGIITHTRGVMSIAVSPDGQLVASGARDHRARLWSIDQPDQAPVIAEHEDELTMITFDPTGRRLATASKDGTIISIDLSDRNGQMLAGHDGPVHAIAFDARGQRLLSASGDRSARLWRVADGKSLASFDGHGDAVYHARFVDGTRIVTGSDDGTVRLWHIGAPELGEVITRHPHSVTAIDVHDEQIASAAVGGSVQIVDLAARNAQGPAVAIDNGSDVWSLAFVPGGEQLATASFDGSPRLWSTRDGRELRMFLGHSQAVLRVGVGPGGRWLATGSYDGDLRLWDLTRPRLSTPLDGHHGQISSIVLDGVEQRLATASHDGSVRLWSFDDGRELAVLPTRGDSVYSLALSPDDARLAAGTNTGDVIVWDLDTFASRKLEGHVDDVWQLGFDSIGSRLVSASIDSSLRVWDVERGEQLLVAEGHVGQVTAAQFEPGDRRIVSAATDGDVRIWDARTGDTLAILDGHQGRIWSLVRSPDGHTLATASDDGTARLWPDDDPDHAIVLSGHTKPVWSIAFDREGEQVVTASYDHDAIIWDAADGSRLRALSGHTETVWGAQFLGDGRVVTASEDNTIRIWPRDPDESVVVLSGHSDAVTTLTVSRDGTRLVSGSADARAKIWQLDHLHTEVELLHGRLQRATIWCLSIERRVRELGEDPLEAARAFATCEATYGRGLTSQ